MKNVFADIIQFRGTHYEFGFKQGEILKDSYLVKNRENQWKIRKPKFSIDVEDTKKAFQQFAPLIWEELIGFRDALKWPMERVLLEFCGYRLNIDQSGCSIYVGKDYLIRNYDYHPKTYDGRYTIFQPTDGGYAMIGPSQRCTGRMDGMNEKGLAMGYNFMNRKRPGDGFVCNMIGRLLLELCANTEEAIALLKEIPHRHSFSYVLFDTTCETPYIVETSPRRVEVRKDFACTNHFAIMMEENRHVLDDSKRRLDIINQHQHLGLNGEEAFRLLNGSQSGVFSTLYESWAGTIHTSAYFPKELKAWFVLGGDQKPIELNFSKWLEGNNFSMQKIEGKVDTDLPFLHMEHADWYS
ncbi:C45 family autoproteolytic acyltransferase/hydolase [Bacillus sp. B1-b2]|uniref:C45 family autoproteolytic acyltransferase/hydolase n=1 Tax=Bacillus sp. B1-b2 TaxID=2653201 RepID=UPI0012619EC8|nr:C45 family peptidase [Bacillus sp. B1-b2]KAB7665133.1 acyl-CoA--6-aminopenicillanic acid acyltransferase [Bacillus sp. B1-b2]